MASIQRPALVEDLRQRFDEVEVGDVAVRAGHSLAVVAEELEAVGSPHDRVAVLDDAPVRLRKTDEAASRERAIGIGGEAARSVDRVRDGGRAHAVVSDHREAARVAEESGLTARHGREDVVGVHGAHEEPRARPHSFAEGAVQTLGPD